jgi:Glycosyl hydrolases family 2, TIM barrel domain/Glycosyl hydrolases family 2, sugar binding domain/Glycosyl hydrolases family 2/Domain of unknown function (DUF4981)/Beta galactosidase small chain
MSRLWLLALFFCGVVALSVGAQGRGSTTQLRYLSGTGKDDTVAWDFFCTGGRNSGVWTKLAVPSNWEQQGFGSYNYGRDRVSEASPLAQEQGKYRLRFDVPAGWKGKITRLVFDGVMTDAEVFVNGKAAGPTHQGSFYRFKYDITPLLRFGESNLLEVTVSKVSANESVNRAERFNVDYWVFGGIFRPVYLEVLPEQFIDWTAIDARADGLLYVDVHLGESAQAHGKVTAQVMDAKGAPVGESFAASITPGRSFVRLQTKVAGPKPWTAETPHLYRVRLTLSQPKSAHTVTERFGFRTFEVRAGDGLYLNGRKITLKGTNRHSFWPETGRTTSRQISYEDVRLIKEMNNNAVRMSHYPPDEHFLEACDELGLYVLDELGGWHRSYDTATGRKLIGEMVRRDVNHPSILFWDNGNEGGWNRENDDEFARWDTQKRAVLHPWELFGGVNTDHYEAYASHTKLCAGPDIYMPTEFLHGLYDGGAGAGLWDYWEPMRKSKARAGGFLWALVDECVARTDRQGRLDCAGNQGPDGIVGPRREREGSFNTVREIWSPVQVMGPSAWPNDSRGVVTIENRYDFTNLKECSFAWRLARFPSPFDAQSGHRTVASGTMKGPSVEPHGAGELKLGLPKDWPRADVLYLTAKDPAGRELWTWSWGLRRAADFARRESKAFAGKVSTREEGGLLIVQAGALELRFSKERGTLAEVRRDGKLFPFVNGPRFLAFRRKDRKYEDLAGPSVVKQLASRRDGADVIVEASYEGALAYARWRIAADGLVRLDYEYAFDGLVDMVGVGFDSAEDRVKAIRLLGMGPYRVWQNRMQGTRLDVWENRYNDTTPGESWVYPEFKGYFRDWKWVTFETTDGRIVLMNETDDSFLGVYKPKDGKDGLLDFPETGIAFLEVIPAMRSKNHSPGELGPLSQQRRVNGITRRTVRMIFSAS